MTLSEFQSFVASHLDQFTGVHPHPTADLDDFERRLGRRLPDSLRWLLGTHGYSQCSGADDLAQTVEQTIACRGSITLPHNWLVVNDWGDAGVVLLDMVTGRLCWCSEYDVENVAASRGGQDALWFADYPAWTEQQLQDAE
ncbi:MAG TPA: SMI1/KNR4 family protein [Tepidisphaeraceae bacterium]|nr:SMI1/KNR4 family protein [Tepidisphaeraceae bacterium]